MSQSVSLRLLFQCLSPNNVSTVIICNYNIILWSCDLFQNQFILQKIIEQLYAISYFDRLTLECIVMWE